MPNELKKNHQIAQDKLAALFDMGTDSLESLTTRQYDPLPSPPEVLPYDHRFFSEEYLQAVIEWVDREARRQTSELRMNVDPSVVQQKVRTMLGERPAYDYVENFPAGYFLG